MKSFNKKLIAFKLKTNMSGVKMGKLLDCSDSSISLYLNGKSCPRKEKMDRILYYINNCFVLPTAYNEIVPPPVIEDLNVTIV